MIVYSNNRIAVVTDYELALKFVIIAYTHAYELAIYKLNHDDPVFIEMWSAFDTPIMRRGIWNERELRCLLDHYPVWEVVNA